MNVLLLVVAAAGFVVVVQTAHCPSGCSCRETDVLTCTGPALDLPSNTGSLSIRADKPLDLQPVLDTLRDASLTKLFQLDLANCSIHSLLNISFNALVNLRNLDLSHNSISQLPENGSELFNLTALRVLNLSNNLIHVIYGSPFRTLHILRVLNLSVNAIDKILVDAFHGPKLLQNLDLSGNNLTELPDGVFASLVSLQHLNLSGNKLRTLADGCFGNLLRLQQLDVSWNQLCHVAPSTLQSLPSLSRLLLADNPNLGGGSKEAALLVGTGRRLQTVDASRTGLKHVPATLTHSVRTLRLAGNSIHVVRCGDLDSYPLLQLLDLTTNELEEIEEDALGRLEMLTVLYLTNNKLRAIPRSLPDRLEILHLEFNHIEQIVSGDLLGMPKLEVLLLNDNGIKVVQEGAFSQVTSLITLDLSRNPISILPGDTLAGPVRLQMLRLSELSVDPPAEDMAFPVPAPEHLVRLDLSGSAGLARQLLADTAALAAFRELQELNLANTDIINIRSDLLHYLPQMHDFHLIGNRLNCSGLLWLAIWMRRQDQPEYRSVACVYPSELYGTLVVDLQDTDVQEITSTIVTTSTTVMTTTGEFKSETTEQIQKDSTLIEVTTIYPSWSKENTLNNITLEKQVNRSTVRGLQNMVKSLVKEKEKVEHVSDRRMVENTETPLKVVTPGLEARDEHRSSSVAVADQLHLFPIVTESGTRMEIGFSTDKTEVGSVPLASVTDGHIDEINPSDKRVATEPSNYKTNAPPRGHSSTRAVPLTVAPVSRDKWTTKAPATDALRDVERVTETQRHYANANEAENFFLNRARDNVTSSNEIVANIFMGQAARQLVHTQEENVIEAAPAKSAVAPVAMVDLDDGGVSGTVGVTSMYAAGANASQHWASVRPTPALFALLAVALGVGAALCSLVSHVRRRQRRRTMDLNGYDRHQDIEVNSLGSMHELW